MSDRRRNLYILLLIVGLLLASAYALISKPTKLGLDLKGGVQLVYQLKPNGDEPLTSDLVQSTIDVMQSRVNALGVGESEIQQVGADQIEVSLPDAENPEEASRAVGTTAQMNFFDWEASVVGKDGKPQPSEVKVTGGPSASLADRSVSLSEYAAISRAAGFKARELVKGSQGQQWYLLNTSKKSVVNSGSFESSKSDLLANSKVKAVLTSSGKVPSGYRIATVPNGYLIVRADASRKDDSSKADEKKKTFNYWILLDKPTVLGKYVTNPAQSFNTQGTRDPIVVFEFKDEGKTGWQNATKTIAQRAEQICALGPVGESSASKSQRCSNHFAVVLDNEVITSPSIDFLEYPEGLGASGGSQIDGNFTVTSAKELASQLKSGSLPVRVEEIGSQSVGATLGQKALDAGLKAGIAGFLIVALALLVMYRSLGLIAIAGLAVYTAFFLVIIKMIPIVMTLPGIAGLILTIAVAADANIVIFERIKDELELGRSVPRAISEGYRKGLSAIIDGNLVTFIVAFVLFALATAGVKGFALTLGIGVLLSMLTAVVFTAAILGVAAGSSLLSNPKFLGARSKQPIWHRFDFVKASRYFFAMSGVILAIGGFAVASKGLNFGVDFKSGTQITTGVKDGTSAEQIEKALSSVGIDNPKVQQIGSDAANGSLTNYKITTKALNDRDRAKVTDALTKNAGASEKATSILTVGPSFGKTIARLAIIAVIVSLLLISLTVALRFGIRYTIPIVIALMHDLLITAGIYALFGAEVSNATVAALLTILGYSIYDTVIVFDRVRENIKRLPSAAFSQIVNRSMSEVLGRSLVTSFATGLPTLALLLFGGEGLKAFALAMLVGTISGAYSSVFIASPILTEWMERSQIFKAKRQRIAAANGGTVPAYPDSVVLDEAAPKAKRGGRTSIIGSELQPQLVEEDEFQQMVDEIGGPQLSTGQSRSERRERNSSSNKNNQKDRKWPS